MCINNSISLKISLRIIILAFVLSMFSCQKDGVFSDVEPEIPLNSGSQRLSASEIVLSGDSVYRITSNIDIAAGKTLKIEPGALVKINDGFRISIQSGAKIICDGTETNPIVLTSSAATGGQGVFLGNTYTCWGGLEIYGQAGISSGSVSYTRIEFAGFPRSNAGLFLSRVDSNTTLHHIQVSHPYQAPSFLFSGSTVNSKYLLSLASNSSDFVFENGHTGKHQFLLAYRLPLFPEIFTGNTTAGFLFRNTNTNPIISNASAVGPDMNPGTSRFYFYDTIFASGGQKSSFAITDDSQFRIANSYGFGFPMGGIHINSANSALSLQAGTSYTISSYLQANDSTRTFYLNRTLFPGIGPQDLENFLLNPTYKNKKLYTSSAFGVQNPFEQEKPDFTLTSTSILAKQADFTHPSLSHPFFSKVNFIGAVGSDNWYQSWTNFIPLQTKYNN
jgi:hypothetical protein